jgi:hypothetical protein
VKERDKTNKLVSDDWFEDHDVFWIEKDKQRYVLLNPGREVVWFEKEYPLKGKIKLTHKQYESDLLRNVKGHIIAVSATNQNGRIKPKPIGTFFELFEGELGYRMWVNPREYLEMNKNDTRFNQPKDREVPKLTYANSSRTVNAEDEKRFEKSPDRHYNKHNKNTRT